MNASTPAVPPMFKIHVPVHIPSIANLRAPSWKIASMKHEQRAVTRWMLGTHVRGWLPCTVTLVRIGSKKLDSHDNLPSALKAVVDGVADALGVRDDSDERITWLYGQEILRGQGVKITVERR